MPGLVLGTLERHVEADLHDLVRGTQDGLGHRDHSVPDEVAVRQQDRVPRTLPGGGWYHEIALVSDSCA